MADEKLKGQATPEQIEEWKKKYGKVSGIIVDGHIGYVRKPDRNTLAYAATLANTNPLKSNEMLLNGCWLGGSDAIKTDDELFLGAVSRLSELVTVKEAELVNL
jgi:hypothetical protein